MFSQLTPLPRFGHFGVTMQDVSQVATATQVGRSPNDSSVSRGTLGVGRLQIKWNHVFEPYSIYAGKLSL